MELHEYLVQTPGEFQYKHLKKPVFFSQEFLASLARKGRYDIESEHNGPKIGQAIEAVYKDGGLWILTPDKLEAKEKGFSTSILDYVLNDVGERYEAIEGRLGKVALTGDPKDITTILYNSKEPGDEDHQKGDDGGNILSAENEEKVLELNQKIGALKQEVNNLKSERDSFKEQVTTLEGKNSDLETQIQERDNTITEKDNIINATKGKEKEAAETLALELAGDDETLQEVYKGMDMDKLKTLRKREVTPLIEEIAGEDEDLKKALTPLSKTQLSLIKEKGFNNEGTGHNGIGDEGAGDQNNGGDGEEHKDPPQSHEDWEKERGI